MSEIPGDLKFMKSHEWARVDGDGKVISLEPVSGCVSLPDVLGLGR